MPLTAEQETELAAARDAVAETRRATVPALEAVLFQPFPVLDHGFVRVIDYMGDDSAIVQAARVSYGRGTRAVSQDEALIRYLLRHAHTTPFEMCAIKLHVRLPIFVARQWIRHRTASVNEYSARYSVLDREFYLPEPQHLAAQSSDNRQGRDAPLDGAEAAAVLDLLREDAGRCWDNYDLMLSKGLARELARLNLTLATYTQWYWKTDLHNLMHFLHLRSDPHAQYEIRAYAAVMLDLMERWVPLASRAFRAYRLEAVTLSGPALLVVRRMLAGEAVTEASSGLSGREWRELAAILAPPVTPPL
jgi:thymidylate synthase (FAD)